MSQFVPNQAVTQQICPLEKMISVPDMKNKLQSAWDKMEEQDFISQPWAIALLVIMAVVSILIMTPTIIQQLPDQWSDITRSYEALRTRLAAIVDSLAPGPRNYIRGGLCQVEQMRNRLSNPHPGCIIVLVLAVCLIIIGYLRPEFFQNTVPNSCQ